MPQPEQFEAFCSAIIGVVKGKCRLPLPIWPNLRFMLFDHTGSRKYINAAERRLFMGVAREAAGETGTFGLALAYSGARISEVLELTPKRIDFTSEAIIIRTLKRRRPDAYRIIPIPPDFLVLLDRIHNIRSKQNDPDALDKRIWSWCRTTAWSRVKVLMRSAGIDGAYAVPKGLRHGFAVEGTSERMVPLNIMQKWLGHARIETTAVYANALGAEERLLAARLWKG